MVQAPRHSQLLLINTKKDIREEFNSRLCAVGLKYKKLARDMESNCK
jgi:hypothetical protein